MKMNLLVVGGGGREHALAWKLAKSPLVERLLCAPGNAGIEAVAECHPVAVDDIDGLVALAERENIDLTIVGPEVPLTLGIADAFAARGLRLFGPSAAAAQLEGSKAFCKEILDAAGAPTAAWGSFDDPLAAHARIDQFGAPVVIKADGLAAGKGVVVATTLEEAHRAVDEIMVDRLYGAAGRRVIVEEFLPGEEASFIALTDGHTVLALASSQDHKRIGDGDTGANTGGMGAYSPAPVVTDEIHDFVMHQIMEPVVATMRERGIVYRGVLYAGLMIHAGQVRVLEFNVRFGDPECQPLMMRLESDLVKLLLAVVEERLHDISLEWDPRAAACVVLAARGYPMTAEKHVPVFGLERAAVRQDTVVFHAGTGRSPQGQVVTSGGRVLGVTSLGATITDAVNRSYVAVSDLSFDGAQWRRDIGHRAASVRAIARA